MKCFQKTDGLHNAVLYHSAPFPVESDGFSFHLIDWKQEHDILWFTIEAYKYIDGFDEPVSNYHTGCIFVGLISNQFEPYFNQPEYYIKKLKIYPEIPDVLYNKELSKEDLDAKVFQEIYEIANNTFDKHLEPWKEPERDFTDE